MKTLAFTAILFLFGCFFLSAEVKDQLGKILPEQIVLDLIKEGSLQNSAYRQENQTLKLLPNISIVKEAPFIQSAAQDPFLAKGFISIKRIKKLQ